MKRALSFLLWPLLLLAPIAIVASGETMAEIKNLFLIAYGLQVIAIALLERVMPHERAWHAPDGQVLADLGHTAVLKGATFIGSYFAVSTGSAWAADGAAWWPSSSPLWLQVTLALVIAELALYWHHRLAHEWRPLWHFHAVHHSVTRLWFVNTGRFHFGDSLVSVAMTQPVLWASGAPDVVLIWTGFITMFVGVLTHCNIEQRFGPLSYLFNTPELHRWHHSMVLGEGNRNYGENLMLWDHVFGTFFRAERRPPAIIGIAERMPAGFLDQLAYPFLALLADRARKRPPAAEPGLHPGG